MARQNDNNNSHFNIGSNPISLILVLIYINVN